MTTNTNHCPTCTAAAHAEAREGAIEGYMYANDVDYDEAAANVTAQAIAESSDALLIDTDCSMWH